MFKTMRIAVDVGNRNVKSFHNVFTSGVTALDKKPARGEEYLYYEGQYHRLSENRIPYRRDKTAEPRFFILTLFAILKEIEGSGQAKPGDVINVQLPIGIPPKHYTELYEKYEAFFRGNKGVMEIIYNDLKYQVHIQDVMAFPQDYAAMMTVYNEIMDMPRVVGIDIGGFTTDYLLMRNGKQDMDYCDSLESGVIKMYNGIIEKVNAEYDTLLEEHDIDGIIQGKVKFYEESIVSLIERQVVDYVSDLLADIRERGIDMKSAFSIFIGGGAIRLRRYIEKSERLGRYMFIEDIKANAKGYDLLYQLANAERGVMQLDKKNPYIFTVGFNSRDSEHVKVARLLNQQGKGKIASFLVKAVLSYTGEVTGGSIDISLIEPMIERMLDEKLDMIIAKNDVVQVREPLNTHEEKLLEGELITRTEAIMESLAAFRK